MLRFFVLALGLLVASCGGLPKHFETQTDDNPSLLIIGAPKGASVSVNDIVVGYIEKKKQIVPLTPGTHRLVIQNGGSVLYNRNVFVQGNTRREIDLSK